MPLNPKQFDRYAQAEKQRQRAMFQTEEVVREDDRSRFGEPSDLRPVGLTREELAERGLAPYPEFLDLPRGVGKLPGLATLGVKLPKGVPSLLKEYETVSETHKDLSKRVGAAVRRAEENAREAQKDRVRQIREGVKPEDLVPYVPEDDGEPFSIDDLKELRDNARSAVELVTREIAQDTTQEKFWPNIIQAWHDSFVPEDFEGTKSQIEAEEARGEKLRRALMDYQLNVGFYSDERGARIEYKNLCEKVGAPVSLDDWTAYRGGEITLGQIRTQSWEDVPAMVDPATAQIVEVA